MNVSIRYRSVGLRLVIRVALSVVLSVATLTTPSAGANAAPPYDPAVQMQQSIVAITATIQALRVAIRQSGSPEAKNADAHVSFMVDDAPVPNAYESNGVIHISNSLHVLLLYLEDVAVEASQHQVFSRCADAYYDYVMTTVSQNRSLYLNAQPLLPILPPENFIALAQPLCHGYETAFPLSMELRPQRDDRVRTMLDFVYLHELGHFALHHAGISLATLHAELGGSVDPQALMELARSRDQEFQADAWSLRQIVHMFGPAPTVVLFDMFHLLQIIGNSYDCSHDAVSTHPDGIERYASLMAVYRDEYEKTVGMRIPPGMNDLFNDFIRFSIHARDTLHCGPDAPPPMTDPHDYGNCYAEHRCLLAPTALPAHQ